MLNLEHKVKLTMRRDGFPAGYARLSMALAASPSQAPGGAAIYQRTAVDSVSLSGGCLVDIDAARRSGRTAYSKSQAIPPQKNINEVYRRVVHRRLCDAITAELQASLAEVHIRPQRTCRHRLQ